MGIFRTTPTSNLICQVSDPPLNIRKQSNINILFNSNFHFKYIISHSYYTCSYIYILLQLIINNDIHIPHYLFNFFYWLNINWMSIFHLQNYVKLTLWHSKHNINHLVKKFFDYKFLFTDSSKKHTNNTEIAPLSEFVHKNNKIMYPLLTNSPLYLPNSMLQKSPSYKFTISLTISVTFTDSRLALS